MGVRVVMLTGDNEKTAKAVAKNADIDEVVAGVLPDGKEKNVKELKKYGKVAMVGDGINDAPASQAQTWVLQSERERMLQLMRQMLYS